MTRSITNREHSHTTYLSIDTPNTEELETRGFMNPVAHRKVEVVWCETGDDVKRYETLGFETAAKLEQDERVVKASVSMTESTVGTNGFAICFVRRTTWLECDMDEAKHEAWHKKHDMFGGGIESIMSMLGGVEGQA